MNDWIDEALRRADFLERMALALASNGIYTEGGSPVDCAPILRDLEAQGYTYRLTTDEERRAKNHEGMSG